jgi:hypothetical protein
VSYTKEDIQATAREKWVDRRPNGGKTVPKMYKWWNAQTDEELVAQVLSTYEFLKKTNIYRIRQASIFTRLYSGKPLYNYFSSNSSLDQSNQMPLGRPTANVVYSCTDTLVSRISQDSPSPVFLTEGGNYKQRKLAQQSSQFIQGEIFRTKSYDLAPLQLRDGCILGNGFLKVYPEYGKVCVDRTLETELLTDFNDAYYDKPSQLMQVKLVDRDALMERFPKADFAIENATHGDVDATPRSTETISDQIIVVEAWHLPSGPEATDGRHVIVCDHGVVAEATWKRNHFPFVRFSYNPHPVNWFGQGLAEILMPGQMEIYRCLIVASQSIELMGVPRILIDEMSKILETAFNNRIGTIIKFRNNRPEFVNAQSNHPEMYQWIQWLIANSYQMSGVSQLAASSVKPSGLNSGEAVREYDGIQDSRFAALQRRYQNIFTDLGYLIVEAASDIVDETGKYSTVYPGKNGIAEVDFKSINQLNDSFVIQCFEESSLPKDPAGRQARLSEMLAAGEITLQEFRRLSRLPDLEQSDRLAVALEERIFHALDEIIDNGDKNYKSIAPDAFILDPSDLATTLSVQYINLFSTLKLEPEKMDTLRLWFNQVQALKAQAAPPVMQPAPTSQSQIPTAPPNPSIAPTSGAQV